MINRNVFEAVGSPQWVLIQLEDSVVLDKVHIMFQGGFVGTTTVIQYYSSSNEYVDINSVYHLEDNNSLQILNIFPPSSSEPVASSVYRVLFTTSSDFYGRITIYNMELYGSKLSST